MKYKIPKRLRGKTSQPSRNKYQPSFLPPLLYDSFFLQHTLGNQAVQELFSSNVIQPKLKLGDAGDIFEQEADYIAEEVAQFSMLSSGEQQLYSSINFAAWNDYSSRSIISGKIDRKNLSVYKKQDAVPGRETMVSSETETRIRQGIGKGSALPGKIRNVMAAFTGYDFGSVRVKTGSEAAELNRILGARAFTLGSDIWLGKGESASDIKLMSHELTHVVQQKAVRKLSRKESSLQRILSSRAYLPDHSSIATGNVKEKKAFFKKEIGTFQKNHPGTEMAEIQAKIMDTPRGAPIKQRENAHTLRGCLMGCAPAPLNFSSKSFSPGADGNLTVTPQTTYVQLQSSAYQIDGKVETAGGSTSEVQDWQVGFLQTVPKFETKGHYTGSNEISLYTISVPNNTRDGNPAGTAPWYDSANPGSTKTFTKTNTSLSVYLWDRPGTGFYWEKVDSKGKTAKLDHVDGKAVFAAWMIVRNSKTGDSSIQYLNWNNWEVDYSVQFNYAANGKKTVKKITGGTKNLGSGAGQGTNTPNLTGTVGNNLITQVWS